MSKLKTTKSASLILQKRIVLFTTVVALLATPIAVAKDAKEQKVVPEGYSTLYTSYEVKKGETLWSIAADNLDQSGYEDITAYIDEIKQINNLSDKEADRLISGQYVIISYLKETDKIK